MMRFSLLSKFKLFLASKTPVFGRLIPYSEKSLMNSCLHPTLNGNTYRTVRQRISLSLLYNLDTYQAINNLQIEKLWEKNLSDKYGPNQNQTSVSYTHLTLPTIYTV